MRIVKTVALELDRIFLFAQNRGAIGQKMICDNKWRIRRFKTKMRLLQIKSEVKNTFENNKGVLRQVTLLVPLRRS